MREEFKERSIDAASAYYNSYKFFENIGLLMYEISRKLTILGYKLRTESYQLPYSMIGTNSYDGFWLIKAYIGRFYEEEISTPSKKLLHYVYGITFKEKIDPKSQIEPWIPVIHFIKGELVSPNDWDLWNWHFKILDYFERYHNQPDNLYLLSFTPSNNERMKSLDKIKSVFCIRVPLGAVNSSEDVERIVKPIINALKHESEEYLEGIKDYLIGLNEKI